MVLATLALIAAHPELGIVPLQTDYAAAERQAAASGRPLLVLFDEVPGCATVQGFSSEVLSHPLVAEAMETEFVPVLVRNNVEGPERQVLERFGEPAWNNPVVRILYGGRELVPRFAGPYERPAFVRTLVAALEASGRPVPEWLRLVGEEGGRTVVAAAGCFWDGEARMGAIAGVVSTEAGSGGGEELVRMEVDPAQLPDSELKGRLAAAGLSERDAGGFRPAPLSDQKHDLGRSELRFVPMTPTQAARVNARVAAGGDPTPLLSPRQRAIARAARESRGRGFEDARGTTDLLSSMRRALAAASP